MEATIQYPGVSDRVKALVVDSIIIILFLFAATYFLSFFEINSENAKIIAYITIFWLYDPVFTSSFGGTIGHMMFGIRVKRKNNPRKNILFPLALIRFLAKTLLGIVSLFVVHLNENRQAIHDYLVNSIVVYAEMERTPIGPANPVKSE